MVPLWQRFRPGWRMSLFVVVMLPTVLALGNWQLNRATEKRALESAYLEKLTSLPVSPDAESLANPFTRVRLKGEFDAERIYLIDNQVAQGQVGYWVVQVFVTPHARYLVNRGFVAGGAAREALPALESPAGELQVVGVVWPFTGLIPVLDDDQWIDGWPKRIQRMDIQRMAEVAGAAAVEIRLEPGQPGVDHAAPFAQLLDDAKHRGYAATWFGLAIALVVCFGVFGFNRTNGEK